MSYNEEALETITSLNHHLSSMISNTMNMNRELPEEEWFDDEPARALRVRITKMEDHLKGGGDLREDWLIDSFMESTRLFNVFQTELAEWIFERGDDVSST